MSTKLTIELVPRPLWGTCLYNQLRRCEWKEVRRLCLDAGGHRCEICERTANQAHEVWSYDERNYIQTLIRLIGLWRDCHAVKHWGNTTRAGYRDQAAAHIKWVNGWDDAQVEAHEKAAYLEWGQRAMHRWTQDLSLVLEPVKTWSPFAR
jgi:hypothetical protein